MAEFPSVTPPFPAASQASSSSTTQPGDSGAAPMRQESFKLSVAELDLLRALADASPHKSRGAVLRDLIRVAGGALPRPAPKRPVPSKSPRQSKAARAAASPTRLPAHPDLLRHIARVGGLVNQVARGIHTARHQGTPIDVVILHFALVVIRLDLEHLRENYTEMPPEEADIQANPHPGSPGRRPTP